MNKLIVIGIILILILLLLKPSDEYQPNQEQIQEAIRKRSINLHLNTNVLKVLENNVEIQSLSKEYSQPFSLNHSGIIWTAGVKSNIPSGLPEVVVDSEGLPNRP